MDILNNIWTAISTPNELLINIFLDCMLAAPNFVLYYFKWAMVLGQLKKLLSKNS
mgnify:CR=1 FL=1